MTLTELQYLLAVARERHFGRAAAACRVSQPTLSLGIKRLEEALQLRLFERTRHAIVATPAGERVIAQAARVLKEVATLHEVAQSGRDPLAGPLRLGAIHTVGPYLFPQLVPRLHQRAPRMPLVIEENFTARLADRLRAGEVDAILVALPFEEPGIATEPLYEEPFVVLLPNGHRLACQRHVGCDELGEETVLLLGPGHCFRDQVLEACPGCAPRGGLAEAVEGGSLETIRFMVVSGLGVTILPCTAAGGHRDGRPLGVVRPFGGIPPRRRIAIAWRHSYPRPEAIAAIAAAVRDCSHDCVVLHPATATPWKR